jgi:hypothetical protein
MYRDDVGPMGPSRAYCGRTSVEVTDDVGAVTCAVCVLRILRRARG